MIAVSSSSSFSPHLRVFSSSSTRPKKMDSSSVESTKSAPKIVSLKAVDATASSFADFGQVVSASPDGEFGPRDAQLDLSRGIPRFYIMNLRDRKLRFSTITHHASVTQCLGSVGGGEWYLGVAKPSIVDPINVENEDENGLVKSSCGHYYKPPHPDEVRVFRVAGPKFLKLNAGTWHAGPLFKLTEMDFYNLELSNTNAVDHTTHNFRKEDGVVFLIED
ncbi:uncharacterized protein LOC109718889 [Ananas comosus]|uniref:Uncharacterized protein LOC109718889 n=3 Tax=Ananas comosus TaxID=4615 RepID=A0A6P5G6S0_ANACO|nr:uncharacterized protein LOC109718889 [Ananas comosus]XP_020100946.1 uncharacterized protein LOC109718889 [Ananas comosus]CAD1822038.1 unnamed protein product [Ananas comosus var. bracteatus]